MGPEYKLENKRTAMRESWSKPWSKTIGKGVSYCLAIYADYQNQRRLKINTLRGHKTIEITRRISTINSPKTDKKLLSK